MQARALGRGWPFWLAAAIFGMGTGNVVHAQSPAPYMPNLGNGGYAIPVASIRQVRMSGTLLQQYDFSCGSAALATLLTHHYDFPITEREVFEQMFTLGDKEKIRREGFSLLDMKRFLHSRGFEADGFQQPLDKLTEEHVPAIALITENGYHHFVVIKGLDRDRVLIGDPANGTRPVLRAAFEANWQNRLLFVIHNRMDSARFNQAADWRTAPQAQLDTVIVRDGLSSAMPKFGPGQF